MTARYNGYFHAKQNLELGKDQLVNTFQDDLNQLIPVFPYGDEQAAIGIYSQMDKAIQKATKVITKHSMVFKVKGAKKPREVNKWIDESYLVIANAHHFKREYGAAEEMYEFIAENYDYLDTKFDAQIWNLKLYVDQQNDADAYALIDKLDNAENFPESRLALYSAVKAQYYIDSKDYPKAIESLQKAAILEKDKFFRIRYNYLLAQLATKMGNASEAVRYYERVIKMNPPYDYAFNAKISMAQVYAGNDADAIIKVLEKMLKDEKNLDYKDQIYFAMAELTFKKGDEPGGIELLKKAISHSVSNPEQKGMAYLKLADYYFHMPNYLVAQAYYDSTSKALPSNHPEFEEANDRKNSLKVVVDQFNIISEEDSLQKIANMSEVDRLKFIDDMIQEIIDEEERIKIEKETAELLIANDQGETDIMGAGGNGEWYFGNPSAMSVGKSDFVRVFGNRKNEDDWRRSNKASSGDFSEPQVASEEEGDGELAANKTREYYLKQLPLNDSLITASNERLVNAYFKLGTVYSEQLFDQKSAIKTFEELLARFKNSKYEAQVLYILYRLMEQNGKTSQANVYKNRILTDYPESEYALIIRNPNLKKQQEENEQAAKKIYEQLVADYQNKKFKTLEKDLEVYYHQYEKTSTAPELFFLWAMTKGNLTDKMKFRAALTEVKDKYPDHRVAKDATDIIKRIDGAVIEEKAAKVDENSIYKIKPEAEHYFIIMVSDESLDLNELRNNISDFNAESFSLEKGIKLKSIMWADGSEAIMVIGISNLSKSISYYKAIRTKEFFKPVIATNQVHFTISVENYTSLFKEKDPAPYIEFFIKNYPVN